MAASPAELDFSALFDALPGAYLVLDLDHRIVAASGEYLTAVGGAKRESLIGRKLFDLVPPGASREALAAFAELRASFERVAKTGEGEQMPPQPYETRLPKALGGGLRRGFLRVRNSALRDASGAVRWIIHWVRDVTESQEAIRSLDAAEEERRAVESRLALALTSSGQGAWDYDGVADRLVWDARARELLGLKEREPFTFELLLDRVHPRDREALERLSLATLDPAGAGELDVTFRTVDGEGQVVRWLEARGRSTFVGEKCVRVTGVLGDVTQRQKHEAHLRLLIHELNHRVKNTLAVVQSIAMQTFRPQLSPIEARERFVERLVALSAAHDVLTRENWEGADLSVLVRKALAPHSPGDGDRIRIEGPAVRVSPKIALSLSLALHELGTNAIKYGALSTEAGAVEAVWELIGDPAQPELHFRWAERGGPAILQAPTRQGFGLRLLQRVLADDIGGRAEVVFQPEGLICRVSAPASSWLATPEPLSPV